MSFPGLLAQPALSFPALEVRGLSRILVNFMVIRASAACVISPAPQTGARGPELHGLVTPAIRTCMQTICKPAGIVAMQPAKNRPACLGISPA